APMTSVPLGMFIKLKYMGRSTTRGGPELTCTMVATLMCEVLVDGVFKSLFTSSVKRVLGLMFLITVMLDGVCPCNKRVRVTLVTLIGSGFCSVRYSWKPLPTMPSAKNQLVLAGALRHPLLLSVSVTRSVARLEAL